MKRNPWLWLAGSLATAVGCSDPPPTTTPPPADVISEKGDFDVTDQDTADPPDVSPPPDLTPPPDADMPDGAPPPDADMPDADMPDGTPPDVVGCSTPGETRCGDICIDTMSSNAHCGRCDNPCTGTQVCTAGVCAEPMTCMSGQSLCRGTCVDTQTDAMNCGACGNACAAGQTCSAGTCSTPVTCPTGQTSCADVCVDLQADSNNCGACGTVCPTGQSCQSGTCRATTTCPTGQTACGSTCVDTNTDEANCGACGMVCPTGQSCESGTCRTPACPTGQTLCGTVCANLQTDTANCGTCGSACARGQTCVAGVCTGMETCPTGQTRCGDACADLQSDPTNCGACGRACPSGNTCVAGSCRAPRPTCASGETDCTPSAATPTCVNTQTNNAHCGACGNACRTGQTCMAGACTCGTGQSLCDSTCVDLRTDRNNCGACGRICPTGQSCNAGACVCPAGQMACGGTCVNTQTDRNNCGACGRACPSSQSCSAGACQCPTGQTACGTGAATTCVNFQNDNANCGACGRACTVAGQICMASTCVCPTGQTSCGSGSAAACVDTQTSSTNCGACGRVCAAGTSCRAGTCMGTPPANDTRTGATVINMASPSQTLSANTTSATNNTRNCVCTSGNDVFFRFTLTQPEMVYADTFGATWDTSLFFQDSNGNNLTGALAAGPNVVCNDDHVSAGFCTTRVGNGLQSQVAARLPAGTYYLVLSGCGSGPADIHFQHLPAGNGTHARIAPSASEQTATGTTSGVGAITTACCSGGADNTHWWITCPSTPAQTFYASTCNATTGTNLVGYDVEVAQFSALRGSSAVCNDDVGGVCSLGSSLGSTIPATTATQAGLNTLIADSCSGAGAYTIRYTLTTPCTSGTRCGTACVNTSSDANNCGACDRRCAAGNRCIAGVCVAPPRNDTPATAITINMNVPQSIFTGIDTRAAVNNTSGTCACSTGNDIFFNFTIPAGPRRIIYADTYGSNWDTALFVQTFAGTNITASNLSNGTTCDDDANLAGCGVVGNRQSQIMLMLGPGAYRLVISGCGTGGTTTNLRFQQLPVGNGSVMPLVAGSSTPAGITSGTGVITQACAGGATGPENTYYWHTCPTTASGTFTASTCGRATWDTVLEQRSASRTTNVCNDDVGGTCGLRSSVTSTIPAGPGLHTLYVDGYGSGSGTYTVSISRP